MCVSRLSSPCAATSPAPLIITLDPRRDGLFPRTPLLKTSGLGTRASLTSLAASLSHFLFPLPLPFLFPPTHTLCSKHPISIPSDKKVANPLPRPALSYPLCLGRPSLCGPVGLAHGLDRAQLRHISHLVLVLGIVPRTTGAQARRPANPSAPHPQDAHERFVFMRVGGLPRQCLIQPIETLPDSC